MSTVANDNLLHTTDYHDRYDTESHLKEVYSGVDIDPNAASFLGFFIDNTVRILKKAQIHSRTTKALEFGGGACLWPSFLLAQYVHSIQFCDYTKRSLNAVKNWIEQNDNAFDWTNIFGKTLENNGTAREKLLEWEARLRGALKHGDLSRCDVTDPHCPILSGEDNQYDIVFSSLCLEAACLTIEMFNDTIKRIVRLLKPGGLLLLLTVRNESFYYAIIKRNSFVYQ